MANSIFFLDESIKKNPYPGNLIQPHHLLAIAISLGSHERFNPHRAFCSLPESSHDLAFLGALVLEAQDQGHGCLPLSECLEFWQAAVLRAELEQSNHGLYQPQLDFLALKALFGQLHDNCPGIHLEAWGTDLVAYTRRQYQQESNLARLLSIRQKVSGVPVYQPTQDIQIPLPNNASQNIRLACADQQKAIEASIHQAFYILSGGPGTGKTTTVYYLLKTWFFAGIRRVGLAAPTGRAAQRLKDSLNASLCKDPDVSPEYAQFVEKLEPATVHRWAGRGALRGLELQDLELLIVDEASMLDIDLASEIIMGLDSAAALILVGDHRQLPAVEDGSIMADLSVLASHNAPWFAHLTISLRAGETVLDIPRQIVADLPGTKIFERFQNLAPTAICQWQAITAFDNVDDQAIRQKLIQHHTENFLVDTTLDVLNREILLCSRHQGTWGTETINQQAYTEYCRRLSLQQKVQFGLWLYGIEIVPGLPLMITRNDASLAVFNGDRGIVRYQSQAWYLELPGMRLLPLDALPEFALSFAMTIHKSQGSEFSHVNVLLGSGDTLCTRELLYTGLTRARQSWTVYASPEVLLMALNKATRRFSRLVKRMQGKGD